MSNETTEPSYPSIWIMEPRDPLLVRDGRPFGPEPGARAISLPFPFPSTLAGGIRTRAGINRDGVFPYTRKDDVVLARLKALHVRGPLLPLIADSGEEIEPDGWLLPAPHDAQLLPGSSVETAEPTAHVHRLVPLTFSSTAQTDLDRRELLLVGYPGESDDKEQVNVRQNQQAKSLKTAPAFWFWEHFSNWLLDPDAIARKEQKVSQLGLRELTGERRVHVCIERETGMAKEGMLFETSGLEFTAPGSSKQRLSQARRLALVVAVEDQGYTIQPGLASFGGEQRLVTWRKSNTQLPECPGELKEAIISSGHCRVCLLTPACFTEGYHPAWLQEERHDVRGRLKALVIQRPQVVSGWDLALGKPKPTRRLAPAGTVLFLSLEGNKAARRAWIEDIWMQCISDDKQARTDGFGLAVLGTWDGQTVSMQRGAAQ